MPRLGRVRVLCPNLNANCLARALLLADLLRHDADVEVIGPSNGAGIWRPARGTTTPIRVLPWFRGPRDWARVASDLRGAVRDATVIVSKPLPSSLGLAFTARISRSRMVLDIDDWEVGLKEKKRNWRGVLRDAARLLNPRSVNTYWGTRSLELAIAAVPRRTVSNRFLQERFGGALLYHVRNPDTLHPALARPDTVHRELELAGRRWVGFIGTPRPHKGVDLLIDAVASLSGHGLLLAGVSEDNAYGREITMRARTRLGPDRLRLVGSFQMSRAADFVSAPDVIAIPSRRGTASRGQVPAKLFDAMALARPIVATDVGDNAAILAGCGAIVAPDDENALARGLDDLLRDPARCRELGAAARARLVSDFSAKAATALLTSVIEQAAV